MPLCMDAASIALRLYKVSPDDSQAAKYSPHIQLRPTIAVPQVGSGGLH